VIQALYAVSNLTHGADSGSVRGDETCGGSLQPFALSVGLALVVAGQTRATTPVIGSFPIDETFVDDGASAACGFPVTATTTGTGHFQVFFNDAGKTIPIFWRRPVEGEADGEVTLEEDVAVVMIRDGVGAIGLKHAHSAEEIAQGAIPWHIAPPLPRRGGGPPGRPDAGALSWTLTARCARGRGSNSRSEHVAL
jgi:hypothetical protein